MTPGRKKNYFDCQSHGQGLLLEAKTLGTEEILPAYFSIDDLAERWRCSRGSVYNWIRGETVVDFARPGHRGKKLVPRAVVQRIEQKHTKHLR